MPFRGNAFFAGKPALTMTLPTLNDHDQKYLRSGRNRKEKEKEKEKEKVLPPWSGSSCSNS